MNLKINKVFLSVHGQLIPCYEKLFVYGKNRIECVHFGRESLLFLSFILLK